MQRIGTILVPVDFGPPSEHALAFAVDLAESLGAKLHLISAFQLPIVGFPDGVYVASADAASRIIADCQKRLDDAYEKHRERKVTMTKQTLQGDAREVIIAAAQDIQADLVVMGTHGRKGIARALIGSVTESVIRASTVPVLSVH